MRAPLRALVLAALAAGTVAPALAQDAGRPMRLRVGPSGFEGAAAARETLEQKIARRDRDFLFRSICRGCLPADAEARVFGPSARPSRVEAQVVPDWPN